VSVAAAAAAATAAAGKGGGGISGDERSLPNSSHSPAIASGAVLHADGCADDPVESEETPDAALDSQHTHVKRVCAALEKVLASSPQSMQHDSTEQPQQPAQGRAQQRQQQQYSLKQLGPSALCTARPFAACGERVLLVRLADGCPSLQEVAARVAALMAADGSHAWNVAPRAHGRCLPDPSARCLMERQPAACSP
jgi:hypothetical protein